MTCNARLMSKRMLCMLHDCVRWLMTTDWDSLCKD